jgi:eukaryotic-like serine/threonine-protein kinase
MAEVWSARDEVSGHAAAIKLINLDTEHAPHSRARFEREAELSSQLRGPNFVEVYGHGSVGGDAGDRAFLAMELLDGESLAERLKRDGKMSRDEVLKLLKAVSAGLRVAHSLQVVHRDLKPANVYFARVAPGRSGVQALDGKREVVKLLDFGVAKDAWDDARITQPGTLIGSAHYMSPEQVRSGRDVDVRADLWSLAVILFRALTGERPFSGSMGEVLAKIVHDPPKAASSFDSSCRGAMDSFFERALQKDPAERFQTVDELLEAFTQAIAMPPTTEPSTGVPSARGASKQSDDEHVVVSSRASNDAIEVPFDPEADNRATVVPNEDRLAAVTLAIQSLLPPSAPLSSSPELESTVAPADRPLSRRASVAIVIAVCALVVIGFLLFRGDFRLFH